MFIITLYFSVHFRVIPILPDMMPMYGSLTIYVKVSILDMRSSYQLGVIILEDIISEYISTLNCMLKTLE